MLRRPFNDLQKINFRPMISSLLVGDSYVATPSPAIVPARRASHALHGVGRNFTRRLSVAQLFHSKLALQGRPSVLAEYRHTNALPYLYGGKGAHERAAWPWYELSH